MTNTLSAGLVSGYRLMEGVPCVQTSAAISTSGPITRVTAEKARVFAAAVKKGAHVISSRLGYSGL